uniref:Glucosamine 6-phosphate N-acetyltransferase n=1 Tax=Elaeophora elaphi TaxID=1147741 RepID=A0A0R3RFR6_9BILA
MHNTSLPSYHIIIIEILYFRATSIIGVKCIVASATLSLEFQFTHQAGYLGRIGNIIVDKTVPCLFLPWILCQYLIPIARHVGVFKLLLESKVEIPNYDELGFKKERNISFT